MSKSKNQMSVDLERLLNQKEVKCVRLPCLMKILDLNIA